MLSRGSSEKEKKMRQIAFLAVAAAVCWSPISQGQGVNVAQAEALLKKSGCLKCHSVSAKKEGPSFKDIAAKYKGKPDGAATVAKQITTNPKMKIDGREEMHD